MDRHREVVDPVLDEALVLETELDFGYLLVGVAGDGINLAVEVELDALLGLTGAEEPEGGGAEGEQDPTLAATCIQLLTGSSGNWKNTPQPPWGPAGRI